MKTIQINNFSSPSTEVVVKYCDSFLSRLKGLMFVKALERNEGVILVEKTESRMNTAIHMFFMNFDLTVLWLDAQKVIVDKVLAKKWMPVYFPKAPAQYVIELHPSQFENFSVGDKLKLSGDV